MIEDRLLVFFIVTAHSSQQSCIALPGMPAFFSIDVQCSNLMLQLAQQIGFQDIAVDHFSRECCLRSGSAILNFMKGVCFAAVPFSALRDFATEWD